MIIIDNHIEHETSARLELGGLKTDSLCTPYRPLSIGEVTNYLTPDQIEELFEEVDTKLHIETETSEWMKGRIEELENKISDLEEIIEEAVEESASTCAIDYNDAEYDFCEK